MSERWKEILDRGAEKLKEAGIEEAGLDAWYLFERAFHMDRVHFLMEQMREAGGGILPPADSILRSFWRSEGGGFRFSTCWRARSSWDLPFTSMKMC